MTRTSAKGMVSTPAARKGVILLAIFAVLLVGLAMKNQIRVALKSGETVTAEFSENYNLLPDETKVKVAGLKVGVVTDVEETDSGNSKVTMKVDEEAVDTLGSEPSARVAPLTLLGGQYAVELNRGGDGNYGGDTIPLSRTRVPVELDKVLSALPTDTRHATRRLVKNTKGALKNGGTTNLRGLLEKAPEVLPPAGTLLKSLQGENPGHDLSRIVTDLQGAAAVLEARDAEVGGILDSLSTTTETLAAHRSDLGATISKLPKALDRTDAGVVKLDQTLDKLDTAAARLRPAVEKVGPLVNVLGPTLKEARPVLAALRPVIGDVETVVHDLVPTSKTATRIVDDVRGPVIDRVNGPVLEKLGSTWRGKDEYKHSGGGVQADNKFYEEIGYMITNLDRSSMTQDAQGSLLNFQAGAGTSSIQPLGLDEMLADLLPHMKGD